jgi:serine/threonine-protein kinase
MHTERFLSLTAGTRVGPYEIIELLGRGGMGEVWKARDTRLGRLVALKRFTSAHRERFVPEARAIAALNEPHICQIYDIGPDYLVLEYIEGRTLQGPFPVSQTVRLALQIAGALKYAHGRGIIHRDLKPGNIMLGADGTAKLLDFGLAKMLTPEPDLTCTPEGTVVGTAAYMSPEQVDGRPVDARSDVFSFGAVLYEMLAGVRAFNGRTPMHVLSAVLHDDPPPLLAAPALEPVIRRCLAKQPEQRYQSIAEVEAALEEAAPGLSAASANLQPSIAVLPFANLSSDKENEYFSDGLSEEIITALTHVPGLKVIARTSAFAFKGKQEDIRRIAQALGVANILEGSVRKSGNRMRVTAQLINASDGSHIWSERYDRDLEDVFAIQDDIAKAVAEGLRMRLAPPAAPRRQAILPAYEAYLKARYYWATFTPEALQRSQQYLEQAITLDPAFAVAHNELGHHFFSRWAMTLVPAHDAIPVARAHARRALELDPGLQEAHALLGSLAVVHDYDWAEGDHRFRLATAREPVSQQVRSWHAFFYLRHMEQTDRLRAVEDQERALHEDPLNVVTRWVLGCCLKAAGKNDEADKQFRQILELDRGLFASMSAMELSANQVSRGALDAALALGENANALTPWYPPAQGLLGGLLVRMGHPERAHALLTTLLAGKASAAAFGLVLYHLFAGDVDTAADWLKKAIEQRDIWIAPFLRSAAMGGNLIRSSSRWPAIAKMVNMAPEQ